MLTACGRLSFDSYANDAGDAADAPDAELDAPAPDAVIQVGAGGSTTCVLLGSGDVYCWGRGNYGSLGDGTLVERATPGRVAGSFWGALSGFTSTLAHAGGPPFAIWMLPQKLDKTTLVATSAVFFLVVNYVKLVPYAILGQLNTGNLTASLLFAPLAPLGIWLGVWLHRRISERSFYAVSYALLFGTGVKLDWDGLA